MALSVAPISSDGSDVDLVAAVRRGSDAAFEELYSRYGHRIGAYVRSMVGDHGRAEDVTQEIFIAALRRMRETERPIAFKPWIYEIAKNACIDSFRRSRRAQEVSLDADDGLSQADRWRLTVVTTPDSALDGKQALDDLRGAFGGLSDSHHEILVLRELEGRSYNDIGERLGMSRPVVESTLFRARRRLAEEYDELASGRRCVLVRKMVDSGPHFSLGLRDRRRIARHLAHCQPCRGYARIGGFDESILAMPRVTAKIAALLPIPLLRARWGGLGDVGPRRARPSLVAWRSVHTLARSSDLLVVAPSAGRGAATAAAIVLAGVGGGIVTVSSQPGASPPSAVHALAPGPGTSAVAPADVRAVRIGRGFGGVPDALKTSVTRGRAVAPSHSHAAAGTTFPSASGAAGIGSAPQAPMGSPASAPGSGAPAAPSTSVSPPDAAPASGPGGENQGATAGGAGGSNGGGSNAGGATPGAGSSTSTTGSRAGAGTDNRGNAGTTSNAGGAGTAGSGASSKGSTPPVRAHGTPKATTTALTGSTTGTTATATPPPAANAASTGSSSTTSSTSTASSSSTTSSSSTATATATGTGAATAPSLPRKNANAPANTH